MARRRRTVKDLKDSLKLVNYLNGKLGYKSTAELLNDTQKTGEGFDSEGQSYVYLSLSSRGDKLNIEPVDLARYDGNIKRHLGSINQKRTDKITLRYFQYLALLYTEIYLDMYFNDYEKLKKDLGTEDLNKLAFWMATGSGKTLIMHINYLQYMDYYKPKGITNNRSTLDNILLITPNVGLSEQHIDEMRLSGISCQRFDLNTSSFTAGNDDKVEVTEITKLVEDKRGGGLSVPVEAFTGNNLIFVDEGHKGTSNTKNENGWIKMRNAISETGFTFEYSATFGQALAGDEELIREYSKSIVFDYSYKYFYGDGFGKEYEILNLTQTIEEEHYNTLLMGNLLSFFEQLCIYEDQKDEIKPYNIEKPLWIFVGNAVKGSSKEDVKTKSDILEIARFIDNVVKNSENSINTVKKILLGKSGLTNPHGFDIFGNKFSYIKSKYDSNYSHIYFDILKTVFNTESNGSLHICDLKGHDGELALKVGNSGYFGLIYVGDTSNFKKLAEEKEIQTETDALTNSIFAKINDADSPINVLIGAKKFIEGWNSFRVSCMGLLNVGQSEGSQIIQLFGRGIRLHGLNNSLKRSANNGNHPRYLGYLEKLNIFAVKAGYMEKFLTTLATEGILTDYEEITLPIKKNEEFLDEGLLVPRVSSNRNFADEKIVILAGKDAIDIKVTVDMSTKVNILVSSVMAPSQTIDTRVPVVIPEEAHNFIDWDNVYFALLDHKHESGFYNLSIPYQSARIIIENPDNYTLYASESITHPKSEKAIYLLNDAVISITRKYATQYYRKAQAIWETANMELSKLQEDDALFQDYTLKVSKSVGSIENSLFSNSLPNNTSLFDAIKELVDNSEKLYKDDIEEMPTIVFDRHLYQPLVCKDKRDIIFCSPPALEDSERKFVLSLRDYLKYNLHQLKNCQLFLLRNLSRGKGIGFYNTQGVYPDFILWLKKDDAQKIVFIEPHGMRHALAFIHDDRVQLYKNLSEHFQDSKIDVDAYIISATPFNELQRAYDTGEWSMADFEKNHILFQDDEDHIKKLIDKIRL